MSHEIKVLDSGYIKLIETWGSDERIIEAARMSTNKGFQGWGTEDNPGDEKLLGFLYVHKHMTPFEMAGMIIEVQAPIIVFREWHRHRTQSYNEMSARYIPMPNENYLPSMSRMFTRPSKNKQAGTIKGSADLTEKSAEEWLVELDKFYRQAEYIYRKGLLLGVPKELARLVIPVARYSRMRASANLRNWLGFLALRLDKAAQWEIRQYAQVVGDLIADKFPKTWELFTKGLCDE